MIAFQYSIESALPNTDYLTLIEWYIVQVTMAIFVPAIMSGIVKQGYGSRWDDKDDDEAALQYWKDVDVVMMYIFVSNVGITNVIFLLHCVHKRQKEKADVQRGRKHKAAPDFAVKWNNDCAGSTSVSPMQSLIFSSAQNSSALRSVVKPPQLNPGTKTSATE